MFAGTFMKVCNTGQLLTKFVEFVSVTEITFQFVDLNWKPKATLGWVSVAELYRNSDDPTECRKWKCSLAEGMQSK
jgi:hypothetical protein